MSKYAILIVAAGASKRLGQPKQLLPYKGSTLLDHTISIAVEVELGPVYVVLGSSADSIVRRPGVTYLVNEEWALGMGKSIAYGVKAIREDEVSGLILMQCDQPFVSTHLLNTIKDQSEEMEKGILLCDYGVGQGPPAYFEKTYFEELISLSDDNGANSIVKAHRDDVGYVSFLEGRYDVDTQGDFKRLDD